ncbi:MAG: type II secretion system F family protein [Gemmatimonadaceae bacterium]
MVVVLWRAWVRTDSGRVRWHEMLLAVPLAGSVRHSAATSSASAALSALLESGVPISTALVHASQACGDWAVGARLLAAREAVVSGASISRSLNEFQAMTTVAVRLVRAGEETGRLAHMLSHASRIEAERAHEIVKSAVRLLEPALIVVFGGMVALVAAALLQAIYSVRPAV